MDVENITPMRRRSPVPNVSGTLPQSTEVETDLLGVIALDADVQNGALRRCIDLGLAPKCFTSDDRGRVYSLCVELWESGAPPVLTLLYDTLVERYPLDEATRLFGPISSSVTRLIDQNRVELVQIAHQFSRRIFETWQRRQIIRLSSEIAALAYTPPVDYAQIAALQAQMAALTVPTQDRMAELVTCLATLATMNLPDLHLIVAPIITSGLTILGGGPKVGKSWLMLNLGLSITSGGGVALGRFTSCETGRVLYLALEDTKRRIVDRARMCSGDSPLPDRLDIATDWPRMDQGGVGLIEQWCRAHPDRKAVFIDTLAMFRPEPKEHQNGNPYDVDYATMRPLKQLADTYDIAVIPSHHMRKSPGINGDPIEELSGTYGLTGAADTVLALKREHGQEEGTLRGRGRDVEDIDWTMRFDAGTGIWTAYGRGTTALTSRERQEVIEVIRINGPMGPTECAEILGKSGDSTKKLMGKMARDQQLLRASGRYSLPGGVEVTG